MSHQEQQNDKPSAPCGGPAAGERGATAGQPATAGESGAAGEALPPPYDKIGPVSARFPDLAGKSAIVTGASRGIGRQIARYLGRQGMRLALTSRDSEAGTALVEELSQAGVDCLWLTADISATDGARSVFEAAVAKFGPLDLLVNNAADKRSVPFLKLDEESYHRSFELNVRIVYELSHLVARHMVEAGRGGSIINFSSVGGLRPHGWSTGYDASKGAIDVLTRSMAIELAPHGIRVNGIAPGLTLGIEDVRRWSRRLSEKVKFIPLGRIGTCEEMAAMVAFLASDAGGYITGQVIYIDGGLTVQLTPPGIVV